MSGISLQPPVDQESGCPGREGCRCAGAGDGGEAAVFGDGGDTYAGGGELRFDLAGAGIATAGMNIKAAVFGIVGADGDRQKRGGGVCDRSVRIGSQKNRLGGDETGDRKPELKVPIDIEAIFHPERPETGRGIGETDENQLISRGGLHDLVGDIHPGPFQREIKCDILREPGGNRGDGFAQWGYIVSNMAG